MQPLDRISRFSLAAVALALSVVPCRAESNEVLPSPAVGPMRVHDQFLLSVGFVSFEPPPPVPLPKGRWELGLSLAAANTFTRSKSVQVALEARVDRQAVDAEFFRQVEAASRRGERLFLVDGELRTAKLRLRRGLGRELELELALPLHELGGGAFDGFLEGFHDVLGLDQDGRQSVVRHDFTLLLQRPDSELLLQDPPGRGRGDAVVSLRKAIRLPRRSLRLMVEGAVKLPTAEADLLLGSGSFDAMSQVLATWCRGRRCVHGGLAVRYLGPWERLQIGEQVVPSALAAYDWAVGEWASLVAQLTYSRSPFEDLGLADLAEDSYQVAVGYRRLFAGGREMTLAMVENLLHFENGADIGLQIGFAQRF